MQTPMVAGGSQILPSAAFWDMGQGLLEAAFSNAYAFLLGSNIPYDQP
jgi:hypothetical protein